MPPMIASNVCLLGGLPTSCAGLQMGQLASSGSTYNQAHQGSFTQQSRQSTPHSLCSGSSLAAQRHTNTPSASTPSARCIKQR